MQGFELVLAVVDVVGSAVDCGGAEGGEWGCHCVVLIAFDVVVMWLTIFKRIELLVVREDGSTTLMRVTGSYHIRHWTTRNNISTINQHKRPHPQGHIPKCELYPDWLEPNVHPIRSA